MKPLRACTRSGCPNLTDRGLCSACQSAIPPRPTARARGYDSRWEKARRGFLAKHTRCECEQHKGKPDAPRSDTVDHIVAHKGNKAVFWDRKNWRASTRACNSRKAVLEEGAFGNPLRPRIPAMPAMTATGLTTEQPARETVPAENPVWFV